MCGVARTVGARVCRMRAVRWLSRRGDYRALGSGRYRVALVALGSGADWACSMACCTGREEKLDRGVNI
jgi:hypothetical protein